MIIGAANAGHERAPVRRACRAVAGGDPESEGGSHPNRSISETMARQIGKRLEEVRSCHQVAKEFGATAGVVSHIAMGLTWRHVFPKDWKPPARRRLSSAQRAAIVELVAAGARQAEIAERFGVTQSAVSHLLKRTTRSATHG